MDPKLARQLGDRPVALDRRQRHFRLEPRVVLLACPLHVLLLRHRRFLRAGLHLSQLSHFRGPPQPTSPTLPENIATQINQIAEQSFISKSERHSLCIEAWSAAVDHSLHDGVLSAEVEKQLMELKE